MNQSLAALFSFLITFLTIPLIIKFFTKVNILDLPERRKIHAVETPTMGGLSIYLGTIISLILFANFSDLSDYKFLLGGLMLMFLLGFRDDIYSLNATQKFIFQIFAAFLVVYFGEIRIVSLYGMMGIEELPYLVSILFSVFMIVAFTNAYNLIDGIDGLAGGLGVIATLFFSVWFLVSGYNFLFILSISLLGSLIAFLLFNWSPSKIFMGDTGSLVLGFIISVFSIAFVRNNDLLPEISYFKVNNPFAIITAILIIPFYDTTRVFILRILDKKSPFTPDKRHIHHILLKQGFDHSSASIILIFSNLSILFLAFMFNQVTEIMIIGVMVAIMIGIGFYFERRLINFKKLERARNRHNSRKIFLSKSA